MTVNLITGGGKALLQHLVIDGGTMCGGISSCVSMTTRITQILNSGVKKLLIKKNKQKKAIMWLESFDVA